VHDGVVTAGLIACHTDSGAQGELEDDTRTVMPSRARLYAFDPSTTDFERALAAGSPRWRRRPGTRTSWAADLRREDRRRAASSSRERRWRSRSRAAR
jgi:hypothetical protein